MRVSQELLKVVHRLQDLSQGSERTEVRLTLGNSEPVKMSVKNSNENTRGDDEKSNVGQGS